MSERQILHVINGLDRGGAEVMLTKLAGALVDFRWRSTVISLTTQGALGRALSRNGVKVVNLGMRRTTVLAKLLQLRSSIQQFTPDIVQSWLYHSNVLSSLSMFGESARRLPLIWNIRHSISDLKYEKASTRAVIRLGVPLSKRVRGIVYNSNVSREQHAKLGYAESDARVIPNGFDTGQFSRRRNEGLRLRRGLGISESSIVVGMLARFHPMKDHRGFLSAIEIVRAEHPSACFVLIGRDVTKLKPFTRGRANIHLVEEQEDVVSWLSGFDVYVSSSAWGEAFSNALAEAMATELPCVVTDVGDSGSIIGNCGLVVPPTDPQALGNAIAIILDMSALQRRELGESARRRVIDCYGISAVAQQYATSYDEVLQYGSFEANGAAVPGRS